MIQPTYSFVVPGPPVGKARARVVRSIDRAGRARTHAYTPAKTTAYEHAVALAALAARVPVYPRSTALRLSVLAWVDHDRRGKPDASNVVKAVEDGLINHFDDAQVVELRATKMQGSPRTEVCIEEVT